jgi:putative ABC transport system permease protein
MRFVIIALKIALRALQRNTLRSLLTTLGIIIGVAAVIAMVGIGKGASMSVQARVASLGNNMLVILSGSTTQGGLRTGSGGAPSLTVYDARAIQRECPAVRAVSATRRQVQQVVAGNQNWGTAVLGVTPEYQEVRDWTLAAGRFLSPQDEQSAATTAVLGKTVVENLFGPGQNPLDQTIRIKNVSFRVVGVLTAKGQSTQGTDQDDVILIPFSTGERRIFGAQKLGMVGAILVSAVSAEAIPQAIAQIRVLLRDRHRLKQSQADDFTIRNLSDIAATAESTSRTMSILLASVASVSMVVGGIGIMNIMLVSVTERTREIGLRLAVGARSWHILLQFLMEAAVLSALGGLCGVVVGVVGAKVVAALTGWPMLVPLEAVLLASAFSGTVGIFFGFYPARKAARLDPIQALRYE